MHPSQCGISYAQAIGSSNHDSSSSLDSFSDDEAPGSGLVVTRKRPSDDEAEPSLEETLKELKRNKTTLEEEKRQRQAAESALQQHCQLNNALTAENAELRRELEYAQQGMCSDAPLVSIVPTMEALDSTQPGMRVPTAETMRRLVVAMSVKVMFQACRLKVHDILRLDGRSMSGSCSFDRQSFRRAFDTNNLSIDMWNDVCTDSEVFMALWDYCVLGNDHSRARARSSRADRPYQRELKGSTAKVKGNFVAMLWHDGRTETAQKWCCTGGAVSMARLRPRAAAASHPTRQARTSTSLTPTMGSISMASPPHPGAVSSSAAEEEEEGYYSPDPDSEIDYPAPQPVPEMVREPIPQHTERLLQQDYPVVSELNGEQEEDVCAVCCETGAVTECNGSCGKWFHWWCERPSHQPDQDKWMCRDCCDGCEWEPLPDCPAEARCVVCFHRKPLTQFAIMLPECECADKGNRLCANCTCTLDSKAESYEQVRCPTCNMHKTSLKLRDGEVVNLVHRKDENGGCEHWVQPLPAPEPIEYREVSPEHVQAEAEECMQNELLRERLRALGKDKEGRLSRRNALKSDSSGSDSA